MQVLVVVIAAGLAFLSKWLLDGGIARRDRVRIREEIELAQMVDPVSGDELRLQAMVRLNRYLTPPIRRPSSRSRVARAVWLVLGFMSSTAGVAAAVGLVHGLGLETSSAEILGLGAVVGVVVSIGTVSMQEIRAARNARDRGAARRWVSPEFDSK